ncbi:glycosyltransferase [Leucobacter sp. wl10]|uniref:glycosyltransferase n=1 Tax=Leucobacter sp. wl10 TaxID=2304677 RepID=UPI0013C37816|nr:glycosyltransferase [Leucobacter sp. wl10]
MSTVSVLSGVACFRWRPAADGEQLLNVGDELGPMLVRAMLARAGVRQDRAADPSRRLLSVGSVMHFAEHGDVVWGSGVNGKVGLSALPSTLDVRAVRGPFSRTVLLDRGLAAPEVYGDPALLLPRYRPELIASERGDDTLVVPNLNDLERFTEFDGDEECAVLSPVGDPEEIVGRIARAGFVIATSLHALVLADAFGVPSRPLRAAAENPFKYLDYYAGTHRADVVFASSVAEALELGPVVAPEVDLDALERAFPWDLWNAAPPEPQTAAADAESTAHRAELGSRALPLAYAGLRARGRAQHGEIIRLLGSDPDPDAARALLRLDQFMSVNPPDRGIAREEAELLGIRLPHLQRKVAGEGRAADGSPLLSVVMPTHNVAPWVGEALETVLGQGIERMEVIVVDDHSTDGTREIVADRAERDERVTLVEAISRGGGTARNIGADHARGKYLVFCDGDDIVPDGAYAALIASLEESGSDIAFGDYLKFRPVDTWRPTQNMQAFSRARRRTTLAEEPTLMYSRPCWNKAFSREWWDSRRIRFPDVARSNDIVPMVRAYLMARSVDIVPDVVYLYRERPGGSSMTARSDSATSMLSYLSQELECAQLVAGAQRPELSEVQADLVYARDTYVQVGKYLTRWEAPSGLDRTVREALQRLLDEVSDPPTWVDPARCAVARLVGKGDFAAAKALFQALDEGTPREDAARFHAWKNVLDRLQARGLLDEAMRQRLRGLLLPVLASPVAADEIVSWWQLVGRVDHYLGNSALALVPEAGRRGGIDDWPLLFRSRAAGSLLEMEQRRADLVVRGRSTLGEDAVEPVLYCGDRADLVAVRAGETVWHRHPDGGGWEWRASFPITGLPLHQAMVPALRERMGGVVVSVSGEAPVPEYRRRDGVLYEPAGGSLIVRRRRHWGPRAVKRGLLIARDRLSRVVGR